MEETAKDYPEVEVSYMYVDNCAMQLVRNPNQFDTIVTSNIFGDILSDEASMISGSIGSLLLLLLPRVLSVFMNRFTVLLRTLRVRARLIRLQPFFRVQ